MTGASNFMERFDVLSNGQRELLSQAEREASQWRDAYHSRESELIELREELNQLRLTKVESGAANPMLLCLIDGDGCIFNERLLMLGLEGGREAASKLRQHIAGHYGLSTDVLVHVFFNREGLAKTIKTYLNVTGPTFNAFINGFNTASPLMSMLDVGSGKEAADAKIRELMRIFVRYPNVKRIYFGGGHDNGYTTNLTALQNEGYLDKIVLLQGYTQLATEIKALGLPCLENNGLFLSTKLSNKTLAASNAAPPAPPMNRARSSSKSPMPPPPPPVPPESPMKVPPGKNTKANVARLKTLTPRACNLHYLTKRGCGVENCPYGHDYVFTPDMLADFRDLVKQNPCLLMNKGLECTDVECPSAHLCPQGPNCSWHKQDTCKFVGPGMHGSIISSEDDDDRVLVPPRLPALRSHNRTQSSSSSMVDFPDYPPNVSPSKSLASTKAPPTPSPVSTGSRTQVKNAFKNSVSGSTTKERLQQMGVGSASSFVPDDDFSDSEEQQYALTQQPYFRTGAVQLVTENSPNKFTGFGMNGHRVGSTFY